MTKQPDALVLAEKNALLVETLRRTSMSLAALIPHLNKTSDVLRQLHEDKQELLEVLRLAMDSLSECTVGAEDFDFAPAYEGARTRRHGAIKAARAAIAKHGESK